MDELAMANVGVELPFGGARIRFRRISTIRRRALIQAVLTEKAISDIMAKANLAYPNPVDRSAYIEKAMLALPSGKALADLVTETPPLEAIVRILAEAGGVPEDRMTDLLDEATSDEVRVAMEQIAGKKKSG